MKYPGSSSLSNSTGVYNKEYFSIDGAQSSMRALAGIKFKSMSASKLFAYNLTIFGFGGVIAPFIGIKVIDLILAGLLHI